MAYIIYQLSSYPDSPRKSLIEWFNENDLEKFNEHLVLAGQKSVKAHLFKEWYEKGIARYCLLYHDGFPFARGAVRI